MLAEYLQREPQVLYPSSSGEFVSGVRMWGKSVYYYRYTEDDEYNRRHVIGLINNTFDSMVVDVAHFYGLRPYVLQSKIMFYPLIDDLDPKMRIVVSARTCDVGEVGRYQFMLNPRLDSVEPVMGKSICPWCGTDKQGKRLCPQCGAPTNLGDWA